MRRLSSRGEEGDTARNVDAAAPPLDGSSSSTLGSSRRLDLNGQPLIFFSHRQADSGDKCHAMALDLERTGLVRAWIDRKASAEGAGVTQAAMKAGVAASELFLLFASPGVLDSFFTKIEIATALRNKKRCAVMVDLNPSSPAFIADLDGFFTTLASKMNSEEAHSVVGVTSSAETLKAALVGANGVIQFHTGDHQRREMLGEVLSRAGLTLPRDFLSRANDSGTNPELADVLILADPVLGGDQAQLIQTELEVRGVVCASPLDPTGVIASASTPRALLVFFTDGIFHLPPVKSALLKAKEKEWRIVAVFEGDSRRLGHLQTEGHFDGARLAAQTPRELASITSALDYIKFDKTTREAREFATIIEKIQDRAGLAPLDFPKSLLALELPMKKAKEFEEGTREWVFDKVDQAILRDKQKAFIFLAQAGMGKSVIAATLARRGSRVLASAMGGGSVDEEATPIAAFHFFLHNNSDARGVEKAVRFVASQMCGTVPGFRGQLPATKEELEKMVSEAKRVGFGELLRKLIIEPAKGVRSPPSKRVAILFDALDECEDPGKMSSALVEAWEDAPEWLALIATARPQDVVQKRLKTYEPVYLEPTSEQNREDLRAYMEGRVVRDWDVAGNGSREVVDAALEQAEGIFLWLAFQEKEMKRLAERGELTVEKVRNLPAGLEGTYTKYFEGLLKALGEDSTKYKTTAALALVVPREPVVEEVFAVALGYEGVEDDAYVMEVREVASQLLLFSDGMVKSPHKSMVDWLVGIGEKCAMKIGRADLAVTRKKEHDGALAGGCERVFGGVSEEAMWVDGGNRDPAARVRGLTMGQRWAIAHAAHHWTMAGKVEQAKRWFKDFMRVYWMVAVGVAEGGRGGVQRVERDGEAVMTLGEDEDVELIVDVVRLAENALVWDPRELGGQAMGRCGIPGSAEKRVKVEKNVLREEMEKQKTTCGLFGWWRRRKSLRKSKSGTMDETEMIVEKPIPPRPRRKQRLWENAKKWVEEARRKGGLKVAEPSECASGLDEAGTSLRRVLEGHTEDVRSVAISSDGKLAITGSFDKMARVWNLETGETVRVLHTKSVNSVAISSDGKTAITGSRDKTARVWNLETGEVVRVLEGHTSIVSSVAMSSDGKTVITGSVDKTARVWDLETGEMVRVLEGHTHHVNSVAISSDGKTVITGSNDKTARVWNLETGETVRVLEGHTWYISSVAISSDGKTVITGSYDSTARVWNVETGEMLRILEGHTDRVTTVAISSDGKTVITGSFDKMARVWNLETGETVRVLEGHTGMVWSVAISSDGKTVITGSEDNTARLWSLETGETVRVLEGHTSSVLSVAISRDGKTVITGSLDNTARAWNLETGEMLRVLEGHPDYVRSVAISNDGKTAITGSEDKTARIWNLETGETVKVLEGHTGKVLSVAISSDGKTVITGSYDDTARVWNVETGETVRVLEGHTVHVTSVAISNDGNTVITGSYDSTARVWNVETGETVRVLALHTDSVNSVAISSDGKYARTISPKETLRWRTDTWTPISPESIPSSTIWPSSADYENVSGPHVLWGGEREREKTVDFTVDSGSEMIRRGNNGLAFVRGKAFCAWRWE